MNFEGHKYLFFMIIIKRSAFWMHLLGAIKFCNILLLHLIIDLIIIFWSFLYKEFFAPLPLEILHLAIKNVSKHDSSWHSSLASSHKIHMEHYYIQLVWRVILRMQALNFLIISCILQLRAHQTGMPPALVLYNIGN